jgi:hypothetical protein
MNRGDRREPIFRDNADHHRVVEKNEKGPSPRSSPHRMGSDLGRLNEVDWDMVYQRYWADNINDMDRQRRKQAEFLVRRFCPWGLVQEIGVLNSGVQARVRALLNDSEPPVRTPVNVQAGWYY